MVVFDNLAHILRGLLLSDNKSEEYKEWKILGEECDGRLIVGWITEEREKSKNIFSCVASFTPKSSELVRLYSLPGRWNIIQASVDKSSSLLSYVVKDIRLGLYEHFIVPVQIDDNGTTEEKPISLGFRRSRQIMTTFLHSSKQAVRLLVLIHTEAIIVHHLTFDGKKLSESRNEPVTKAFNWAQWDCLTQTLYFIHFRKPSVLLDEEPKESENEEMAPTLSGFQFHPDMPHETVLNIPLNLPSMARYPEDTCLLYEDDCIPLRIHDCSLDLLVVSNESGMVFICHHYLYQPVKPPTTDLKSPVDDRTTVHFAYSITLLHHGCVVHCALPGVPWALAKTLRPGFVLLGAQYLLIHGPQVFTHVLDVGLAHEPFCHIMLPEKLQAIPVREARLVRLMCDFTEQSNISLSAMSPTVMLDLLTLDLLEVEVAVEDLIRGFSNIASDSNRQAILHYFLVHMGDLDLVEEALGVITSQPCDVNTTKFLQEVLVGGAYSIAQRNLPSDAANLVSLLPMTSIHPSGKAEVKVNQMMVSMSQEILWNTAMMLLSPQQRLVPYRTDIWTKLWDQLAKLSETPRFRHSQVADKLIVSLNCYQPEALSRCTTPLSPATSFVPPCSFIDVTTINQVSAVRKNSGLDLPFVEIENCTASKQEHIISVNLRELNMYLLKNSIRESPIHVHAVATRYVTAQLEVSKQLCHLLTRLAGADEDIRGDKGFSFIRALDCNREQLLFKFYQRFYHAAEILAYPLPQGFTSFFCYLGFRVLPFDLFLQYLHSNVFQLQIDVMKEILKETEDTVEGVHKKLRLLQALPRSRAKRLLNTWSHPVSLMIRAREHALNVLSGVQGVRTRAHAFARRNIHASRGLAAFPSGDRVSPLDTFLDLLTAKASLTDIDFNLLIEATISSSEDILE